MSKQAEDRFNVRFLFIINLHVIPKNYKFFIDINFFAIHLVICNYGK